MVRTIDKISAGDLIIFKRIRYDPNDSYNTAIFFFINDDLQFILLCQDHQTLFDNRTHRFDLSLYNKCQWEIYDVTHVRA
jgi:hypothetical protein